MKKVTAMVVLMLTPISCAASRSWAVERIARPIRVRLTNKLQGDQQDGGHHDDEHADPADRGAEEREAAPAG